MKSTIATIFLSMSVLFTQNVYSNCYMSYNHDYFTTLQNQNSFVVNDHVVWHPEFPTIATDQTVVLYDTNSPSSKFSANDQVTAKFISSDQTQTVDKLMVDGEDGIKYAAINQGDRKSGGFLVFTSSNGFDNWDGSPWKLPLADQEPYYIKHESQYLNYYYLSSDLDSQAQINQTTTYLNEKIDELQTLTSLSFTNKVQYFYSTSIELQSQFHVLSGNYAESRKNSVYVWESKTDLHEITHLLFNKVGNHAGIFAEGAAVYFGQENIWRNNTCDEWAKYYLNSNTLPPIEDIATFNNFQSNFAANYPIACSFSGYLINQYGLAKFKEVYSKLGGYQYTLNDFKQSIEDVYSTDLNSIESSWKNSL